MKLVNGMNRNVPWNLETIKKEASQEGNTSIVTATCDDGTTVDVSQHDSGTWDISVEGEPAEEYYQHEGTEAVQHFMRIVQQHNGKAAKTW
jgi:hypothetical protein